MQLILYPALVQGDGAAASIVRGIHALDVLGVDVIIVGRGGGSIEDLWAFNEEEVARAIFACNTPVISAVGHQTDTTISDYVADLRAPTPSAAAELAVFDVQLVEKWLMDYGTQMRRQLELKLNQMRTRLMHDEEKLRYLNPRAKLKENEKRLDELGAALERRMQATLEQKRHTLALLSGRLDGMSPLKKLAQGYSYVEDAGGHALTDADTVQIGEALSIHLYRGSLKAAVTEIRKQRMVWRKEESMDNQNEKKPTLEEAFTRIEAILTQMEQPEISREESFSLYQQGVLQLKNCGTILDEVEKKMQILGEDGEIEEM